MDRAIGGPQGRRRPFFRGFTGKHRRHAAALAFFVLSANPASARTPGFGGFLENIGQFDGAVRFSGSSAGASVYFTPRGVVFDLAEPLVLEPTDRNAHRPTAPSSRDRTSNPSRRGGCVVRINFEGAAATPIVEGHRELPGRYHFFLGDDPSAWHTGARAFSEVRYRDVWPGIDLVYRIESGHLEYDALVRPGADPSSIRFEYEGADHVVVEPGSAHRIETPVGSLIHYPVGPDRESGAILREKGGDDELPPRSGSALQWSTFLGGSDGEQGRAIAHDLQGRPLVVGETGSDFPTTSGVYDPAGTGTGDAFIAKLDASGSGIVWATYLGGSDGLDLAYAVSVDPDGNVVTAGRTRATDFPTTPGAFDSTASTPTDDWDLFVTKLTPDGDALLWSTYLGGGQYELLGDMTLDQQVNVVLTGVTESHAFPTTPGAYREALCCGASASDVFITKIAADGGSLVWSTLLGSDDGSETGSQVELDPAGNPVVAGITWSPSFPTTEGAYDETWNGGLYDGFAAALSPDAQSLLWSTYVGGAGDDEVTGLAIRGTGDLIMSGRTSSSVFDTTTSLGYDHTYNGLGDAFVLEMDAAGSDLGWWTFLGGGGDEITGSLGLGPEGSVVVVGTTESDDFPTTPDAYDAVLNGSSDGFVSLLSGSGQTLLWSTYVGGSAEVPGWEGFHSWNRVAVDGASVLVTGIALSDDFPTTDGAWDREFDGPSDAVLLMILLPQAVDAQNPSDGVVDDPLVTCSPNPFRRVTRIRYDLPRASRVDLRIFDVTGRLVRVLERSGRDAGRHAVSWDGRDDSGAEVAAGRYFYRFQTASFVRTGTMVHVK